ncbi:MAG: hypothetical protein WDZ93_01810 [Candidatus Paceibacterota bacterium]
MGLEYYALTVHITTVFALIATVVVTDVLGLLWVTGRLETLSRRTLTVLHRLVWVGLLIMIVSGATMFLSYKEYLLTVPAFYVKMGFVLTLVVNAFVIGRHMHIATVRSFAALSKEERRPLFISGAVSTTAWVGAVTAALMLEL